MRTIGNSVLWAAVVGLSLLSGPTFADPITISDPALADYTLPYGDFNIVSLQFAGTNYYVASSPGQLQGDNAIVVGSGSGTTFANGAPAGTATITGIDAPYATENGKTVSNFTTADPAASPTQGMFAGDTAGTWNTTVGALNTALAGQAPVFYFNLNENGTTDVLSGTDLLLWAKVTVIDPTNNNAVLGTYYVAGNPFDPNNMFGAPPPCGITQSPNCYAPGGQTGSSLWNNNIENYGVTLSQGNAGGAGPDQTQPYLSNTSVNDLTPTECALLSPFGCTDYPNSIAGNPQAEEWTYVHGDICVNGSTLVHYGSCTGNEGTTVKQNLGANQAAFAAYSISLDDLLASLGNSSSDVLQLQWEMSDEDNGYEQLFILGSGAQQILVPEPATISVAAAGLALLGFIVGRRRKAKR